MRAPQPPAFIVPATVPWRKTLGSQDDVESRRRGDSRLRTLGRRNEAHPKVIPRKGVRQNVLPPGIERRSMIRPWATAPENRSLPDDGDAGRQRDEPVISRR